VPVMGLEGPGLSPAEEEVTYACEYCRTKYGSYGEAEACEAACQKRATASTAPLQPQGASPGALHGLAQAPMLLPVPLLPQLRPPALRPSPPATAPSPGPPELASLLSGSKGALIGKGLQVLAAKGVLPGLLGKGAPPSGSTATAAARGKGPSAPPPPPGGGGTLLPNALAPAQQGSPSPAADPFLREVQDFMERWDLEKRFEPKLVAYLKRTGAPPLQEELQRLEQELRHAGVPPVCRSGYLLVVFGEVSEKSTDEDFRYLLTGKPKEGRDGSPSPEKRKEDAGDGKSTGTGAKPSNDRIGVPERANSEHGNSERESRGGNSAGVPPLSEAWMNEEIDATCMRFKLDETVRNRLTNAMRGRAVTFKEDMRTLNDVMRAAKHPKGAVQLKLREIERGTFSARSYSPLGPTPAEKQDMERAAKEKEKEGERKEEAERREAVGPGRRRRSRSHRSRSRRRSERD